MKKTILAIDDDTAFLTTLKDMLDEAGYEVVILDNPVDAEKYIEKYGPVLLIMDVFMPGRTGFNLLEDFKERGVYQYLPKIFITCLDDDIEKMTARACGVEKYITKPFEPGELIGCVKEMIGEGEPVRKSKPDRNCKLVIADDNLEICELVKEVLEQEGYYVDQVHTGYELLAYLEKNTPSIIILDLMMPDKDGLSIITPIKTLTPSSRIIIHTGYPGFENSVYARSVDRFLMKGSTLDKLIETVEELSG